MSQMNQIKASSFSGCILVSLITGLTWFKCLTATFLTQIFLFNIHVFLCALSCSLIPIKWAPRFSWAWEGQRTGGGSEQILGKTRKTEQLDYFFANHGRNPKNIKNALISRDLFCSLIAKQRPTQRRELANQRLTQTSITKAIGVRWLPEAYSIRVTVSVQWSKVWFVVQVRGTHRIICPTRIQWTCGKFEPSRCWRPAIWRAGNRKLDGMHWKVQPTCHFAHKKAVGLYLAVLFTIGRITIFGEPRVYFSWVHSAFCLRGMLITQR